MPPPRCRGWISAVAGLFAVACGGSGVDPFSADPGDGGTPTVASVDVTSAIDTVIAVGRSAQLTAAARASDGSAVPGATFTWTSSNTAIASINGAGLVSALSAGRSVFSAASDGAIGSLALRAVEADLDGSLTTINDAFATALRAGLSSTAGSALGSTVGACASAVGDGNVLAVDACLTQAAAQTGSSANDTALLAVHDLFTAHAQRLLNLGN